jgi:LacI family transcriptional regulator
MKKATIVDVAKLAGVSIKTVSRVLNREPKVRQTTLDKVERAMKDLSYHPNSSGRRLASNRTYLVGLIYDNTNFNSGYINNIQNGALESCREEHYDLLLYPFRNDDPDLCGQLEELITDNRVDGLLITPPISDRADVRALMEKLETPFVDFSRESADESDWTVCTNDHGVCVEVVMRLARLGHQRIAFVKGDPEHRATQNRYLGFLDGMQQAGLKVLKSLVFQGDLSYESGMDAALRFMRAKTKPTAIFCANDQTAAGAIKVIHEMGLSIPGDISIVGFDDVPLASQIWPQLTTVRQPLFRMSRLAGRLLIKRLRGESPGDEDRVIKADIIVRESTGPAPVSSTNPSKRDSN